MNRPAAIFSLVYLGAVVYLSLYPWEFLTYSRSLMLFWVEGTSRRVVFDTLLNVLFYVPLGAAALTALGRSTPAWIASVLGGTLLSLAIELAQLFTPMRYGNLRDVVANSCGTLVGASAAYLLLDSRIAARISPLLQSARWRISATGALFLSLWMLWQTFPFVPNFSLYELSRTWAQARQFEWSWTTAGRSLFGFYVVVLSVGARSRWLPVAFLALPAQVFLVDHTASLPAIVGALAGWAAARVLLAPRIAAAGLVTWLAVEEFRPFRFAAQPTAFNWAPFQSWFDTSPEANYPIYFSKTFLYTSVVWALRRCGLDWTVAVLVPAAILAAGEWTQRSLEGRTPETTDLVLLAAGALLLKLTAHFRS